MNRYVCIHGHFYQPPRENPWLEEIELQDSAYPYHNWNERINVECYAANAVSRILTSDGRIRSIANNYADISFNFGPTLLAWMAEKAPDTYQRILEADALSRKRFSGHGSAIAQAYNHMIMPLANRRDKVTQVKWGIADFRKRFGREPDGMWLPETSVDLETLDILAEYGIRYTILAPNQAARTRPLTGGGYWHEIDGRGVDTTHPYVQNLPSGRHIALFFYDGPISQGIAFEQLLASGEAFAGRLLGAFPKRADSKGRDSATLVHIATDGETYGHHHRHGDMALAFALKKLDDESTIEITNYGEFLERHPPRHEVQIHENTAWSCAHGVGRWSRNCGCHSGRDARWTQGWREPLRAALDFLRDELAPHFEQAGSEIFHDPWAARDDYISVILERNEAYLDAFLHEHATRSLDARDRTRALKLMELQRNLMLMYTSCGWFFDELSGIETVQVIHYAGRAVQLASELFDHDVETPFLDLLEHAKSNIPEYGDGRRIYNRWVKPSMVNLPTVGGHYAISSLFRDGGEDGARDHRVFCYDIERIDRNPMELGRSRLDVGRVRITSRITLDSALFTYAALHLGDHNALGSVREFRGEEEYARLLHEAREAFSIADVAETIRRLDRHFGDHRYTIMSLFRDEQRRVLAHLLTSTLEGIEQSYRHVFDDNIALMQSLSALGAPLPAILRTTAEFILNLDIRRAFETSDSPDSPDIDRIRWLFDIASTCGLQLDSAGLSYALQLTMERVADQLADQPADVNVLERLNRLADAAHVLPFEVDLWRVQNAYFELREAMREQPVAIGVGAGAEAGDAAQDLPSRFVALRDKLRIAPIEDEE